MIEPIFTNTVTRFETTVLLPDTSGKIYAKGETLPRNEYKYIEVLDPEIHSIRVMKLNWVAPEENITDTELGQEIISYVRDVLNVGLPIG